MPVRPGKVSSTVWPSIWNIVQEQGLKAGDQLPSIRELAERLEVKQTAVRDAFLKAETLGLIKVQPRAGAFLRANSATLPETIPSGDIPLVDVLHNALVQDDHNLFQLLDARRLIEIEMAGRAAERRRLEDLLPVRRVLEGMLQLRPARLARSEYVEFDVRFHVEIARVAGNHGPVRRSANINGIASPSPERSPARY